MNILNLQNDITPDVIETDFCVVGSGPAGGILSVKLAENKKDVLLLEAGDLQPNYDFGETTTTKLVSASTDLRFGGSYQLGGSADLWAGRTHPMEAIDLEQRPWIENSGWPFTIEALDRYYRDAAFLLGLPGFEFFQGDYLDALCKEEKRNTFSQLDDLQPRNFQWAQNSFSVSNYLTKKCKKLRNLRIFLNARVSNLEESENTKEIKAAVVRKPDGKVIRILARQFILAAGGIETPRIMLSSQDVRKTGIGNDRDVVGRYFSTHPKADMAALILKNSVKLNHAFFVDKPLKSGRCRLGLGFSKEAQKNYHLLNHYVQLSPILEYQATRIFDGLKNSNLTSSYLINKNELLTGYLPSLGKFAYGILGRIAKLQPRTRKFILRTFLDQYPNPDNRVQLSEDFTIYGTRKASISWKYSSEDKESVLKFFNKMDESLRTAGIGRIEYSGLKSHDEWPLIGIHSHFMGTTRFGTNKSISVTDGNCAVHDIKNLYIAGPSLFPTYGFANPFLTITALSLRLGEYLLEKTK